MSSSKDADQSEQPALFPLPIKVRYCNPANLGTADCGLICRGDDGCDYVIKDNKTGGSVALTPHSEWFCTQLGELVGIASPQCKIVEMSDSTFTFGSRWEGGVIKQTVGGNWWDKVKSGDIKLDDIKGALSHIYAFDHFIYNPDRHPGNFIVRDQHAGYAVLANDYSRAWMCAGFPLPALPMNNATVSTQRWLSNSWAVKYIDKDEANILLDRIRNISKPIVGRIINGHPNDWLPKKSRDDILNWWGSKPMLDRLDEISKGVENGSYL